MSENRKDVFLLSEPRSGVDRPTLVRNLAATFKKDVPSIEKMLRRQRSLIKGDIDAALAAKYKMLIEKAGGQCLVVGHDEPLFPAEALQPAQHRAPVLAIDTNPASYGDKSPQPSPSAAFAQSPAYGFPPEPVPVGASPYKAPTTNVSATVNHYCHKCGTAIAIGTPVCPSCHTTQILAVEKSKVMAGFLAFFLGAFGVHRFYLGQWWGIFYLLFLITGIPSIVSFVEAFVFWFTPRERWLRRYGHVPKQGGSMAMVLIIAAIVFIAFIGILAAIALPAYQDYTTRAKLQAAMPLIESTRDKVTEVIVTKDFLPSENIMAGLPDKLTDAWGTSIRLMEGAQMEVTFAIPSLSDKGNTIIWTPKVQGDEVTWTCLTGTLPDKYRMRECRGGTVSKTTGHPPLSVQLFNADKTFSIRVPSAWKENKKLNEDADIGVARLSEELYTIVLSESKIDFEEGFTLDDYTGLVRSLMNDNVKDMQMLGEVKPMNVNGLPARQMIMFGTVEGVKVAYLYTIVESNTGFYQVLGWTIRSRFDANLPLLKQVGETFTIKKSP